jgi:sec-independent protein translocase protein TatC
MSKQQEGEMSFLEHLEVLRWHIIKSVVAILIMGIIAFIFKRIVFDHIILAPKDADFITNIWFCKLGKYLNIKDLCINTIPLRVINTKMAGQFSTHIMVSFMAGIILAFPYVLYQFWSFVSPALYVNEKSHTRGAVFYTSILFLMGVGFGYFILLPLSTQFFSSYIVSSQVDNYFDLNNYIASAASITLGSGVVFELPIIIYFLAKIGVIGPAFLIKYRKHSIVLILLVAAIITPPDIFSQIIVSLPLFILYEVSIVLARRVEKKRKAKTL